PGGAPVWSGRVGAVGGRPGVWWGLAARPAAGPVSAGLGIGAMLRERARRRQSQRLLDLQSEEIIYSNNELEKKFRDLESKIEQLSLLIDLSGAVNATLDTEKIYEQALNRLVHRMGYQDVVLFLVDGSRRVIREHRVAGTPAVHAGSPPLEFPLEGATSAVAKVAVSGLPLVVSDVDTTDQPVHRATARAGGVRAFPMFPLHVKGRVFGVLVANSAQSDRFDDADVELLSAVGNHVSLAVDRAESFQMIEELTRGLEDKVRVRTEQLRAANE